VEVRARDHAPFNDRTELYSINLNMFNKNNIYILLKNNKSLIPNAALNDYYIKSLGSKNTI